MADPGEAVNPHIDNILIHRNGTSSNSINEAVVNQRHTLTLKKTQPCILFPTLKRFEITSTSRHGMFSADHGDQLSRSFTESLIQNVFVHSSFEAFSCVGNQNCTGSTKMEQVMSSLMHLNRINNTFLQMNNPHSSLLTTVD